MSDILQIFTGNPLSTFIGKKIEASTRPDLDSEDWALNMEICDIINSNDDDAKDAARAIKKRIQQIEQDHNFVITNRTLTVLETCVSNCSHRFHILVMTKDFIQDLVKLIGPKNNPPIDLQERVLSLIERWAEAFRSQPDLNGVWSVYQDLKAKGVTFPQRDPNSHVPIQTPQRTVHMLRSQSQQSLDRSSARLVNQQQPLGQVILEGEGYNKISQDLTIVQSSIEMLNDIMSVLDSPGGEESDWKLASDLSVTCRQMKDRIVELIERVANEDLTIELLRLNDELNNLFTKYDRLVKNKAKFSSSADVSASKAASPTASALPANEQQQLKNTAHAEEPRLPGVSSRTLNELSLIDFNAMNQEQTQRRQQNQSHPSSMRSDPFDTSSILTGLKKPEEAPTDGLARLDLDSTPSESIQQTSSSQLAMKQPSSGLPDEVSSVREQDFAEIENWLSTDSGRNLSSIVGDMPNIEPTSVPNSEFENFIASRALAGSTPSSDTPARQQASGKPARPEPSV